MYARGPKQNNGAAARDYCAALITISAIAASSLVLANTAFAQSANITVGPPVQITGPSPFRHCTADDVQGQEAQGSTSFPDSEIEPYIDINPRRLDNLVAVWQQDRWSDGGSRGVVSAVSEDGGATWNTVSAPDFTVCSGGTYERATDPWVTYAGNGDVYFQSLSFDSDPAIFGGRHALLVSKSTDGGHTWSRVVAQIKENDPDAFNDKNSMTADPTRAQRVFGIWDRLELFSATASQRAELARGAGRDNRVIMAGRLLRAMRAKGGATARALPEFKGPTYFTRTLDGGASWERATIIYDPGANNQTINNLIEIQPDGTVIAFFSEILNFPNGAVRANISLKRSIDHGFSFRPIKGAIRAHRNFSLAVNNFVGTFTPDLREAVRDAGILFDTAVDRRNGNLYLVWQDSRFSNGVIDEIAFSKSTDSGRTWTAPIKINQTPRRANQFREAAFLPTVTVNDSGIVTVTYYDFRNDTKQGELADQFALFCHPAANNCANAERWGPERRLTSHSFDMLDAPDAGGHFLGDYMGSESLAEDVHPAYGVVDGTNEVSVFTRKINVAPGGARAAAH